MKDFHCHLLPGLDDGAQNLADTEKMLACAARAGIDTIAGTSHYSPECEAGYDEAWSRAAALAEKYSIRLLKGMEYDLEYIADIPREKLRPLGGSRYLLVDMNRNYIVHSMANLFFELKLGGFEIIFAHPERMLPRRELEKLLALLQENAIFIQLDSGSLTGRYGKTARDNAFFLLDHGGCHFLWNDAHRDTHFAFEKCRTLLEKRCGQGIFELLTEENPAALLADGDFSPSPRRMTFWQRLFQRS